MNLRRLILPAAVLFLTGMGSAPAQDADGEDKEIQRMESVLQQNRAEAVRARLVLYSDELRKLHTKYTAAGETGAAAAVQKELDAAALAVKRLSAIILSREEPPEAGELKKDERLSGTALAARRIDAILAGFSQASGVVVPAGKRP